ncbi:MAG: flippase activity-associated protein Agl23 [Pirellulaceae bacterium]
MTIRMNKFVFPVLLLLLTAGALLFRAVQLQRRPMHADEAVQAFIARDLWLNGKYVYDPNEYHGPTMPYASAALLHLGTPRKFSDTTEATFRRVPVWFGAGTILMLWLLSDALGKPGVLIAGLLTAISPAMVFYHRYYIHETMLVFFTLAAMASSWRYTRSGNVGWCLAAGACLGLMQATKETSVLVYAAAAFALVLATALTRSWNHLLRRAPEQDRIPIRPAHLLGGLLVAILVAVTLLSSFFTNLRGPWDGVLTYLPWTQRAGGDSAHLYPWYHYFHMLAYWQWDDGPRWSEGLILALAGIGFLVGLLPVRDRDLPGAQIRFVRWLGWYSVLLAAAYSAIPYKTPWCLLGFHHGFILLAGFGAAALVRWIPTLPLKALLAVVLLAFAGQLGWQSYRTSFVKADDPGNPYVYVHTLPDMERLYDDVGQLAQAAPEGHDMIVKVVWHDGYYWPLPWYLRDFSHVGYWDHMPADPAASLVLSSPQLDEQLTEKLNATHLMTGYYGVRPNVLAMLWVRVDVWEAHLRRLGRLD